MVTQIAVSSAPQSVTVSGSPFSWMASDNGMIVTSGGTVSLLEYGRNGVFTNLGLLTGVFPIRRGDVFRVTFSLTPPTFVFIPG